MLLVASLHAIRRARERLGWNRHALQRMLDRIYHLGATAERARPPVRARLARLQEPGRTHTVRLFTGHVFVFARDQPDAATLLTLYRLEPDTGQARGDRPYRRERLPRTAWVRNRSPESATAQPGSG